MRRPALALLLGCLLLVAGASALDGYDYYQTIEYAACDQDIYQQDIVIHRSTGTAYNETAGGLETWHIFVGEHCREDYGDVRFTNSTGELEYYLWPDYDSSSARFCVRLEGADAAGVLRVWYGNPSATTTSDGDATYFLHDHFDGDTLDTTKWQITHTSGTTSLSNSHVHIASSVATWQNILSKQSFNSDVMLEFSGYAVSDANHIQIGFGADMPAVDDYAVIMSSNGNSYVSRQYGDGSGLKTSRSDTLNSIASWGIAYTPSSLMYYHNGALKATHTKTMSAHPVGFATGYQTLHIDWAIVRAYSATPPAALTFSGEQEAAAPPITAFTATPAAGLAPLTVQFTDTSAGSPTSWAWTFGDSGTSTAQNPQHTYTAPGTYSVNLTATNEHGSDYELKTDYITVYGPITAQFTATPTGGLAPLTVQFTDLSAGGPTSWLWTFGDGGTSTEQNPQHTYTTAGTHTVALTASHPYGSDTETKTAYITVAVLQPFPGLALIPRDLTGNGLYTDINGNGRLDYNDLTVFFLNLAWARDNEPTECFDFNQNGRLDYADVIALFQVIKNA